MFDYLELDYNTKKRRDLRSSKSTFRKRRKIASLSAFSNNLKAYISNFESNIIRMALGISALALVILTALVLLNPIVAKFEAYSKSHNEETKTLRQRSNQMAFEFLIDSGKDKLLDGRIEGAYKEFKLAHDIYPKNKQLEALLVETLSILCDREPSYCKELEAKMTTDI